MEQILFEMKKQVEIVEQMIYDIKDCGASDENLKVSLDALAEIQKNIVAAQFLYEVDENNGL